MPTPRQHGGAALALIPLTLPGFKGLTTTLKNGILGPEWATRLENAVVDSNSRIAARRGWDSLTTTPAASAFVQLHAHLTHTGTERLIAASATALYHSTNGGATWSDITNSLVFTTGNWQFVNFNDKVYGIQQGEDVIESTTGNFASVAATNVPSGNCILAAFGRLWAADSNGTDLRYSALLAGADWDSADAGVFDLRNVWPGTDTITALAAFNNLLVVFGRKNIVLFTDGTGSALGLDPTAMIVSDIVTGTGCAARDSVQSIDGDLWFLSDVGVQSLGRLVIQKSNPLKNLSANVEDDISRRFIASDSSIGLTRSAYSPKDRLYLLSIPAEDGGGGSLAFDTRGFLEDGAARCLGHWSLDISAMTVLADRSLVMALEGVTGEVGDYSGGTDDGDSYDFIYESGWMDLTKEGYLLIPKRYSGTFFTDASVSVNYMWAFDFSSSFVSRAKTFSSGGGLAEFGEAEFGEEEFGGGIVLRTGNVPGAGTGEYIKLGISTTISGQEFSIQQLDLFAKVGRLA
jgi:hypothetical protein